MPDSDEQENENASVGKWLLLAMGTVTLIWAASIVTVFLYYHNSEGDTSATVGQFGDAFGVVNALFSGLAFAGVIVAIFIQRKEFELQRIELRETRKQTREIAVENERQRKEFEKQNAHLARQSIHNQFFQLLNSWQSLFREEHLSSYGSGELAMHAIVNRINSHAIRIENGKPYWQRSPAEVVVMECMRGLLSDESIRVYLSRYFSLLFDLLALIDTQPDEILSEADKLRLAQVVRSHMSNSERLLLLIFCHREGMQELHRITYKYDFFDNLWYPDWVNGSRLLLVLFPEPDSSDAPFTWNW